MKYKIAHIGAFDFENFGDLLFTDVVEKQLEKRIEIEKIMYFAPKKCKMPNREVWVNSVIELEEIHKKNHFDALVVGGGDLIHLQKIITYMPHLSSDWITYEVLYMWVIPSIVAWKYNIPLIWNAPGVPLEFMEMDRKIVEKLCECVDYISVRDEEAKNTLAKAVESEKIKVVPDTVLSISELIKKEQLEENLNTIGIELESKKYVFFQCNVALKEEDLKVCGETLIKIKKETGYKIVLQPIGYALGDEEVINKMSMMFSGEFVTSEKHLSQYQILALIANAALYIGTSLHGSITATSYGTPNIVYNLNHYNKTDGFVKLVGKESTRIYEAKELWNAYLNSSANVEITGVISEIETHFDKVTDIIQNGCEKKDVNLSMEIAEYIYSVDRVMDCKNEEITNNQTEYEKRLEQEMKEKEEFQRQLKRCQKELNNYRIEYEKILNSHMWKALKPIRKIKKWIK